jgi:hypothetical protein
MTTFKQTKEFQQLQRKIAQRNATMQQARQQLDANNAYLTSEFDAIKRNLSKIAARIKV